jgi:hypothetical protein
MKTPKEMVEELKAKVAAVEPQPVLDPLSVKHGRCSMMNDARKIIEETMVQLASRFETGHYMSSGWDNIVLFNDTLLTNLRKVDL